MTYAKIYEKLEEINHALEDGSYGHADLLTCDLYEEFIVHVRDQHDSPEVLSRKAALILMGPNKNKSM